MKIVYIGIGSNLGDPQKNCRDAIKKIDDIPECEVEEVSTLYLTEPIGVEGQEWYINAVARIKCGLEPDSLMKRLLEIEREMGRIRNQKWESRLIDLDILLYGDDIIQKNGLTIPHPLMHERRFVLAPIADLAPELIHPRLGMSMSQLLAMIPDENQGIEKIEDN